jgi:hypothetical protein
MSYWRAGCGESRTSGSGGDARKRPFLNLAGRLPYRGRSDDKGMERTDRCGSAPVDHLSRYNRCKLLARRHTHSHWQRGIDRDTLANRLPRDDSLSLRRADSQPDAGQARTLWHRRRWADVPSSVMSAQCSQWLPNCRSRGDRVSPSNALSAERLRRDYA